MGVGALSVTVLAGCGGGSSGGDGSPPVHITTPPVDTGTPTPPSSTPTPTATVTITSTPAPTVKQCRSSHLQLSLGASQGAAGSTYQAVVLTNTGHKTCTLFGYPGVSFVDAGGTQLGSSASQSSGTKKTITLAAGGAANATLRQPNPGNFDPSACNATTADRLRVFPPGETAALFVHDAVKVCTTSAGRTAVTPVAAGTGD